MDQYNLLIEKANEVQLPNILDEETFTIFKKYRVNLNLILFEILKLFK